MKKTKPQYRGMIGAGFVLVGILAGGVYLIHSMGSDTDADSGNPLAPLARAFGLAPKDFSPPPITSPIPDYHKALPAAQEDSVAEGAGGGLLSRVGMDDLIMSKEEMRRSAQESAGAILGTGQVIDGDTLIVAGQTIRLYGIDAPELAQNCLHATGEWDCGRRSALWLQQYISTNAIACQSKGADGDLVVAVCTMGDVDVAGAMVKNGWALAYKPVTKMYAITEGNARRNRLGLWDSQFSMPWDYRQRG